MSDSASTVGSPSTTWRDRDAWPAVDVVLPIRNEAQHLEAALASVRSQVYPATMHIVIGVGPSTDGTEALAQQLAERDDDLTVVENPTGTTPAALNLAIRAGTNPVVVRVDGHSQLAAGYIRRAVEALRSTGASNVGGVQRPEPTTDFERAVADATTSLLGTGGAAYRVGSNAKPVDTVYLGVFDRHAIESVGLFDESLIRNQDYELNIRLRHAGGLVWFDPSLSVGYVPRSSWASLGRQYFEYGWWKSVVMRKHPRSIRVRQIVPPLGMIGVIVGLAIAPRWRPAAAVPVAYLVALSAAVRNARQPLTAAAALVVIHASWAAGLVGGLTRHRTTR